MSQKKLLFFDIDGTIISETTGLIPKSAIKAIKQAQKNGHKIFINTGRPLSAIPKEIIDLNPDGYVCGCGTHIYYHDNDLYLYTIDTNRCKELVDLTRKCKVDTIFEGKNSVYLDEYHRIDILMNIKKSYQEQGFSVSSYDDPNISFDKFASWFDETSNIESFKQEVEKDFTIIVRDHNFYEIVPKNHSKATGIQFLVDYFHESIEDCYVFGDSYNDLSMLTYVKHAIVMGNAPKDLYQYAYFVTKDIEDDGMEFALQHLKLI